MFSKLWIINLCIMLSALFCGFKAYQVWSQHHGAPVSFTAEKNNTDQAAKNRYAVSKKTLNASVYNIVTDRNLFSPERMEYVEEDAGIEPELKSVRVSGKEVTLYGVIVMGNYRTALINNPVREKDDSEYKWIKSGEMIGELKIDDIRENSILLDEKGKKYEILLYDKTKKRDTKTKTAKKEETPNIIVSKTKPKEDTKKASVPAAAKSSGTESVEYEEYDTPFGKMKRRKTN